MSSESLTGESTSERDVWRTLFWTFALGGLIAMVYYEYLWSLFALHNLASVSFVRWCWVSLAVATPWNFCFICLWELRRGVRNGSVGRDVCSKISVLLEMVMLSAYGLLAPEIQRLTSLGALK
jgi:hypothetical protein